MHGHREAIATAAAWGRGTTSWSRSIGVALSALCLLASCGGSDDPESTVSARRAAASIDAQAGTGPLALSGAWLNFGHDPQHGAVTTGAAAQPLSRLVWRADVDVQPDTGEGRSTGHYGSPVITAANTVIVPVKLSAAGSFRVEARNGADGSLRWRSDTDYVLPHPNASFNAALTPSGRVYFPGAGGKLFYRDNVDGLVGPLQSVSFYGKAPTTQDQAAYDVSVLINTPLTIDAAGTVYFGFQVRGLGRNPLGLASGIARVDAAGRGRWVAATTASGDDKMEKVQTSAAPALSQDGRLLYVAVDAPVSTATRRSFGHLLALDSGTLQTVNQVFLTDPRTGGPAAVVDSGTASPAVGPDGDVYFGVLADRGTPHGVSIGWMLHFNADLTEQKTPGGFGWDITPSFVPASLVGGYAGSSPYLLATKYNDYISGQHLMAVLDPNASQPDRYEPGVQVMKEVITILSPNRVYPDDPADTLLYEWCINTAAVDPATGSVFMNSSDGFLYRWDMATNTLSERFNLNSGYFQSYTPTALGPDGKVYSINNAVLMVIGR